MEQFAGALPTWLNQAVSCAREACAISLIGAPLIAELRKQILGWAGRKLGDKEELPAGIHQQLKNAVQYNNKLASMNKWRQSVRSFIIEGKWSEAPAPPAVVERIMTPEEMLVEEAMTVSHRNETHERHMREQHQSSGSQLPYREWRSQEDLRFRLWMAHCKANPKVSKLPVPPLVEGKLDLEWRTKRPPTPGPLARMLVVPTPPSEPLVELMEAGNLL